MNSADLSLVTYWIGTTFFAVATIAALAYAIATRFSSLRYWISALGLRDLRDRLRRWWKLPKPVRIDDDLGYAWPCEGCGAGFGDAPAAVYLSSRVWVCRCGWTNRFEGWTRTAPKS